MHILYNMNYCLFDFQIDFNLFGACKNAAGLHAKERCAREI